jgi:hypothetical protein
MINREQLKLAIDGVDETQLEILHRIILAFKEPNLVATNTFSYNANPLKDSVIFEGDIISPIHTIWEADQ